VEVLGLLARHQDGVAQVDGGGVDLALEEGLGPGRRVRDHQDLDVLELVLLDQRLHERHRLARFAVDRHRLALEVGGLGDVHLPRQDELGARVAGEDLQRDAGVRRLEAGAGREVGGEVDLAGLEGLDHHVLVGEELRLHVDALVAKLVPREERAEVADAGGRRVAHGVLADLVTTATATAAGRGIAVAVAAAVAAACGDQEHGHHRQQERQAESWLDRFHGCLFLSCPDAGPAASRGRCRVPVSG
jgi:hypothetical protein